MLKHTAARLFALVGLVVLLFLGTYLLQAGLKPPTVKFPDWKLQDMPLQFGPWRGENVSLDRKIFESIGANYVLDRLYRDDTGHAVSLHVAMFDDPDLGVYHSPINCYRSAGWQKGEENTLPLQVANETSIDGNFSSWERAGEHVAVLYWYQIGEHVLFDRFELGRVRWAMRGKETWPATVKVLMQLPGSIDPEQDKARLRDLAGYAYRWLNEIALEPAADLAGK